jgi:serine phosphatase RsbU (regulator of sigma subunit)
MCMMTSITRGFILCIICSGILIWLSTVPGYVVGPMPTPDYYTVTFICQGFFTLLLVVMFDVLRRLTLQESKRRKVNFKHISNELLSSIEYARRIRAGILPAADFSNTPVKEVSHWESAKQAISGDFLYSRHQGSRLFICLADSSGHGVPGGIISALGICFLDEAILGLWMTEPMDILHFVRTQFRNKVRSHTPEFPLDDGMVAAIICIDIEKKELRVASSQTLVKLKTELGWETIKASRYPLSFHPTNHLPFTQKTFNLQDVKELFMATDGVTDQLNPEGKRFTRGRLEEFCSKIPTSEPVSQRLNRLQETLLAWRGDAPQTDDILAVWMRIDSSKTNKPEFAKKQSAAEQVAL